MTKVRNLLLVKAFKVNYLLLQLAKLSMPSPYFTGVQMDKV